MASGASAQLAVDAARVVAFGSDDGESARLLGFGGQLDVGSAAGHVGGDGHGSGAAGFGDNVGFLLVQLGVQHLVRNLADVQRAAEQLRNLDRGSAYQYGSAGVPQLLDFVDDGVVLLAFGFEYQVVAVFAFGGHVGRNHRDLELVYLPEFARLGFGRTGHARELVVHSEVVLQRDGRVGLCGGLNGHPLFGFNGLVQAVGITAAVHDAAGLLVDDLHFAVHHHVLDVFLKQRVGLEQLVGAVNALALGAVLAHQLVFAGGALGHVVVGFFDAVELDRNHRKYKKVSRRLLGQEAQAQVGEVHLVVLFFDREVQGFVDLLHLLALVLQVDAFGLLQQGLHAVFRKELDEGFVLGKRAVRAKQLESRFGFVAGREGFLGFGQGVLGDGLLLVYQRNDKVFKVVKLLLVPVGGGSANDERSPRVVDQDGVDLVHDRVVVAALHELRGFARHVVAQVVKTKLVVGSKGDVGQIGLPARLGVGAVLVNALDAEAVELVERTHPLGVALRQVVVDRDDVHAASAQGIEVDGQRGDQGFALTGGHFGNAPLVQHDAAKQLHVVVHHVPSDFVARGKPAVVPHGGVALKAHGVESAGELAVPIFGRNFQRALGQAAGGFAKHGKGLRKDFEQNALFFGQNVFVQAVDLAVQRLFGVDVLLGFGLNAKLVAFGGLRFGFGAESRAESGRFGAEFCVSMARQRLFRTVDLVDVGLDFLQRALRGVSQKNL